jgi:hypothetical protein
MPKTPIDYKKTIIYKIVCLDLDIKDNYVGSTTCFVKRECKHKADCNNKKNLKIYNIINNNGGWNNWEMIEIEKYPCTDSNEARMRERYYYEQLKSTMNSHNPNRTHKEWEIVNTDQIKASRKIKYCCPTCKCEIVRISKLTHDRTEKHKMNKLMQGDI